MIINSTMLSFVFLVLVSLIFIYYYIQYKQFFSYWRDRSIKHETPWPIIGNHGYRIFNLMNNGELGVMMYRKYPNERFVGYYRGSTPELYIRDPEFFKYVFSLDFDHFYIRAVERNIETERMMLNLFNCSGDSWRLLRHRLTPAFTHHKLTKMFPLIVACAKKLQIAAAESVEAGGTVDAYEMMARYAMECICSTGFGLDTDIISEKKSQFLKLGDKIISRSKWQTRVIAVGEAVPSIWTIIKSMQMDPDVKKSLINLVKNVRSNRNYVPSGRNDFIDLLIELETKGTMRGLSFEKKNLDGTPAEVELELDVVVLAAQVYIFFAGGFATSAVATSTTLHFLAFNPEVQRRVQKHTDQVFARYNNEISYESISDMSLLDMAIKESMRLFPPIEYIGRICTREYTFPGTDVSIDPGVRVVIPIQGLYMDEQYYDNPTEYRPERFSPEEVDKRPKYTYLPFGEGQRKCIGARLGTLQSIAGVAAILQHFDVAPAPSSKPQLEACKTVRHVQIVDGGLPIKLIPRVIYKDTNSN